MKFILPIVMYIMMIIPICQASSIDTSRIDESQESHDEHLHQLIQEFIDATNAIFTMDSHVVDEHDIQQITAVLKKPHQSFKAIQNYITSNPNSITQEQLHLVNTTYKKLPKKSDQINQRIHDFVTVLQNTVLEYPAQVDTNFDKIAVLQEHLKNALQKDPYALITEQQYRLVQTSLQKLPQQSVQINQLLQEFHEAVQAIPIKITKKNKKYAAQKIKQALELNTQILNTAQRYNPTVITQQARNIAKKDTSMLKKAVQACKNVVE